MECDINSANIPVCICQRACPFFNKRKRRQLCGSNGQIYDNFCELYRDACQRRVEITISDMSVCTTPAAVYDDEDDNYNDIIGLDDDDNDDGGEEKPNIVQPQQPQCVSCSADEYALMKDNLLLFHHKNMAYLQHGDSNTAIHRMDYLVSIIFSHYDQNNDGLVEKDELALMWNTMDMHHVANDSNCTLLDMILYDDTNNDRVLTINEFNDAFHRISETNTDNYRSTSLYGESFFFVLLFKYLLSRSLI